MNKLDCLLALTNSQIESVSGLVKQAGLLALKMRESARISEKNAPGDFVTDADLACSKLLVDGLACLFPQDVIISEEQPATPNASSRRVWLIDPIDGTENYIKGDGMYSVMVGLLIDAQPCYGWVYSPVADTLYFASPDKPVKKVVGGVCRELPSVKDRLQPSRIRLMMGNRDRKQHPWVEALPQVEFVYSGSVGLRVAKIIEGEADAYIHLAGKLKLWDTAAPAAMASAAGLDAGTLFADKIEYAPTETIVHSSAIAMGRAGLLDWLRALQINGAETAINNLTSHQQTTASS